MKIRNIFKMMALTGCLLSLSPCVLADVTAAATASPAATTPKQPVKFLQFVLSADSADVQSINSSEDKLVLNKVDPSVVYFTNRPRRITNTMPTGFFAKRWVKPPPHDFKTTPPNAVIVYVEQDKTNKVVVMLMNPDYSESKQTLAFTIQSVNGDKLSLPAHLKHPTIMMAEVTMCGLLGSWGNLPGEKQYDVECHEEANAPAKK